MPASIASIPGGRIGWIAVAAVLLAVAAAGIFVRANRVPHLPYDAADGDYTSDCCGNIELRDGYLYANGARLTGYLVLRDARGPYLLPDRYVGTMDTGVEVDGSKPPRMLRLDTLPHPTRIEFPDAGGRSRFKRKLARPRQTQP